MITFNAIDIEIPPFSKELVSQWIYKVIKEEKKKAGQVFFLFTSDAFLFSMNESFLKHAYFTDVITFDTSEQSNIISGEIYISLERVKENAEKLKKEFPEEFFRTLVHGVLHLIGYNDKTEKDILEMRTREDEYLNVLFKGDSTLLFT